MSLVRADAINIPLADDTVDLIVTSPPYFALRSYTDGGEHYDGQIGSEPTPQAFLEALWAVTAECRRVLKPSGSLWVNLGDKYSQRVATRTSSHQDGLFPDRPELKKDWKRDRELGLARMPADNVINRETGRHIREKSLMGLPWRYAIGCIDDFDLILRAEVIWSKPNGLPESVTDRVRRSHEQWFHFTKEPRYFAAVDEVREPHKEPHRSTGTTETGSGKRASLTDATNGMFSGDRVREYDPLGKLPGSVWTIPSEPLKVPDWLGVDHFAAFPQEWPRRIILGWSPSGICVECGDGRRPVVAKEAHEAKAFAADQQESGRGWHGGDPAKRSLGVAAEDRQATITGYACACPTPDAPTRPAVVLDPFGGTGTVAMVARALGRYPVHLDLSADYLRLARWRIHDSGASKKSVERTNLERQGELFGDAA